MNTTILEGIVGSTVYGTAAQDGLEDLDLMAVVVEDQATFMGLSCEDIWVTRSKPQGVRSEAGDVDHVAYGLKKYVSLALKGNPSILLALFIPNSHIRVINNDGHALRSMTTEIVSKKIYQPFKGYMHQQFQRLMGTRGQKNCTRPELVEKYGFDTKYAGHVVRLGLQGAELLRTGHLTLPMVEENRKLCVDVRTGKYTLAQVENLVLDVTAQLDAAYIASTLPENPDYHAVETWMLRVYFHHWRKDYA